MSAPSNGPMGTAQRILGVALATAILLAVASAAPRAEAPPLPDPCAASSRSQTPADVVLEKQVEQRIGAASFERLTEIAVAAVGGTICLRGTAANSTDRQRAETIAAGVPGVVEVVNHLRIPLAR